MSININIGASCVTGFQCAVYKSRVSASTKQAPPPALCLSRPAVAAINRLSPPAGLDVGYES